MQKVGTMSFLGQIRLFDGLSDLELAGIQKLGFPINLGASEYVFQEGSLGHQLYVILSGRVEILMEDAAHPGSSVALATLGTHDIFGEFSLFDDYPRSASAFTLEPASLLEFHKADLWDLFEQDRQVGLIVLKNLGAILCERMRAADNQFKTIVS
jgi:CRP-like cAMP-binding protein